MSEYEIMSPKHKRQALLIMLALTCVAICMIMWLTGCSQSKYFQTRVSKVFEEKNGERYMFYGVYNKHKWVENLEEGDTVCLDRNLYKIK